ncbi:uncharacterized protein LOC112526131 [Cynara cardunculus var. scolymus]|uniref:Uncharacterized protein n=1 Tax=Cynara cardunculus var. scolymus TaxID=59895 RepID=A0A103Y9X5_CYNCS|nr:uncharacterized protein LOC112526131 [Cynara cardunculus var. scolymus]KVI05224.1 hypothetical protein Ccrd_016451 [Cynara cardunculus var. scolymus]
MMNSTGDYNPRIGNSKRNFGANRALFSHPSDNLFLATFLAGGHCGGGGLLSMPPAHLSHSYPPGVSVFRAQQNLQHNRQQPPLLPLPIPMPLNHQNMNISRTNSTSHNNIRLSSPRINKSVKNRVRDHSLTPKKSKNQKKDSKKEEGDLLPPPTTGKKEAKKCSTEASVNQLMGPDPKDLPKAVISRAFSSAPNDSCDIVSVDKFSGSVVFTPSPPPSSLPLPTFSLRPKLSCKAEAAIEAPSIDAGATDSLRRLLRLR